jgi:hypothetical protein
MPACGDDVARGIIASESRIVRWKEGRIEVGCSRGVAKAELGRIQNNKGLIIDGRHSI